MDFKAFNLLDYSVLFIIGLSTVFALFRGFIGSVLSLTGWVLSIYLTYVIYPHLEPFLSQKFSNKVLVTSIASGGTMIAFLAFFGIINAIIGSKIKTFSSTFVDSVLGGAFGCFRGFLIVSFFYLFFSIGLSLVKGTNQKDEAKVAPSWLSEAQVYNLLKFGKSLLLSLTSADFNNRLENFYESMSPVSKDQRFISYAIDELKKSIPREDKKRIESGSSKESLSKSEEEVEISTLSSLLNAFEKQPKKQRSTNLTEDDISRLKALLENLNIEEKNK